MTSARLFNQRTVISESNQQRSENVIKAGKGESINRIAKELQKKERNQDLTQPISLRSYFQDGPEQTSSHILGEFSLGETIHKFRQKPVVTVDGNLTATSRHQMINLGPEPHIQSRRRSEEEFPSDRSNPDSPTNMIHMQMRQPQALGQSHSSDSSNEYEEGSKKRKRYDDEASELEDLEQFAKDFKQKRIKMGFTQGDVGVAMGKLYGNDFSQTTISRFEALNLSVKNMCKLKPLLERWLVDVDRAFVRGDGPEGGRLSLTQHVMPLPQQPLLPGRRRKKRTSIPTDGKNKLEDAFNKNPKPTSEEIYRFSEDLKMDREVVRVWFCNRRQKQKRITIQQQYMGEESSSPTSPSHGFGSHSISGERPASPSSDDDGFHTSQQMPPIMRSKFTSEPRLNPNPAFTTSELTAAAGTAVKAPAVPKAVPAGETPFSSRLPVSSFVTSSAHPSTGPHNIRPSLAGAIPPPPTLRPGSQNFSPHIFASMAMKSESSS